MFGLWIPSLAIYDSVNGTALIAFVGCTFKYNIRKISREGPKAKISVLKLLLTRGACTNQQTYQHVTPLGVAWNSFRQNVSRSRAVIKLLLENEAYDHEIWQNVIELATNSRLSWNYNSNLGPHHSVDARASLDQPSNSTLLQHSEPSAEDAILDNSKQRNPRTTLGPTAMSKPKR